MVVLSTFHKDLDKSNFEIGKQLDKYPLMTEEYPTAEQYPSIERYPAMDKTEDENLTIAEGPARYLSTPNICLYS